MASILYVGLGVPLVQLELLIPAISRASDTHPNHTILVVFRRMSGGRSTSLRRGDVGRSPHPGGLR